MIERTNAHPPDQIIDAQAFAVVSYQDAPIALEIVASGGTRIGVPLTRGALAGLLLELQAALEAAPKSDDDQTDQSK